mmetsp:Transcript_7670/g.11167  ORF Transcript_7670/g.11167 Transcript_7670/m.11167 type:complete len:219 (-) Transcript_7670:1190-1846(-)
MSARFVPASTTTPLLGLNPSISTNNWLRVFSRSSFPPEKPPLPRARPTASISSIKTMQGAFSRASLKRSRTREGPTPTNISMKSDPEIEKNGTAASPATAFASKVFPVPGGPHNNAPFGIFAPSLVNLEPSCKKSTNSIISFFASAHPATSLKVTFTSSLPTFFALLFPILKTFPIPPPPPPTPPPPIFLMANHNPPRMKRVGRTLRISTPQEVSEEY